MYIGNTGYVLIVDNVKQVLRKGQIIDIHPSKLKTRKLKQLFKEIN